MANIAGLELFATDLPFRRPFKHAAAERESSDSLFVKCVTDSGEAGFGESVPRQYVTRETRDGAFKLLQQRILPRLLGKEFDSMQSVKTFLTECDGKAPEQWVEPAVPQTAAWCAVDLALLDAFGKVFKEPIQLAPNNTFPEEVRYSPVISVDAGFKFLKTLLKVRLYSLRQVKLKVDQGNASHACRMTRRVLGKGCDIRVDANMAWDVDQALSAMGDLSRFGVRSFEQPLVAEDIDGLARLVRETGLGIMVDESFSDRDSLRTLIGSSACTAVNVRISKCGGLMAAMARSQEALDAGLKVQIGCQVGESSLLSAAHVILIKAIREVVYAEGCFGLLLLREDPMSPVLQFSRGGAPPEIPDTPGFGVNMDETILRHWTMRHETIE